jgi:pyruvate/2-oxoglutarate dehydrogenase complex dihydrolipoamide acyltransferase (E2) component
MVHAILMPKPGQMTEECTVIAWHKKVGDPVTRGDVLFEIETDKSTMDVEAFDDGVLLKVIAAEGDVVPVNTVCAYVGQPDEAIERTAVEEPPAERGGHLPAHRALAGAAGAVDGDDRHLGRGPAARHPAGLAARSDSNSLNHFSGNKTETTVNLLSSKRRTTFSPSATNMPCCLWSSCRRIVRYG